MMPYPIDIEDALFVATDLTTLSDQAAPATLEDVDIEGRIYRPLDPMYYAWLRTRMQRAQVAFKKGKLSRETFEALRSMFNRLHDQAVALFGEDALLDAVEALDPKAYAYPGRTCEEQEAPTPAQAPAPSPETSASKEPVPAPQPPEQPPARPCLEGWSKHALPAQNDPERFHFNQRVTRTALAQVDAIRDQAISLGWTEAQLYQTRGRFAFPCGGHYGLVCFLHRGQHIGEVTPASIAIVHADGHALRFYRNEVNHD